MRIFAALTIAIAVLPLTAGAVGKPTTWEADTTLSLGEVTVSAIKQNGDMRLQPIASTVVGRRDIERYNIVGMKNVSELAPNFYIPDYGSRITSSIYVRGIGARIDQSSVGLNVDNVPFLSKDDYDFDLSDISRVEVLRGAQSSLYGRNTMAGQINIYTLSPMAYQGTRAVGEFGSGLTARLSLSHYVKFNPNLGMGFSGSFNFSDGFYKNLYNCRKVGTDKSGSLRWKTAWTPSDNFSLNNVAAFSTTRQGGYAYELLGSEGVNYNDTCYYRRNIFSDGLTLRWGGEDFSVSSITSAQYVTDDMTLDQDFTPQRMFTLSQRRHELTLTQDFVINGRKGGYSWLAGVFGFIKNTHMRAPVRLLDEGISTLITDRVNNNDKIPIKLRWNGDSIDLGDDFTLPVRGAAVYHQSSFETGRWNFGVGLRLDYEWTGIRYHSYSNTACSIVMPMGAVMPMPLTIDNTGRLHNHFLELLPKISVSYRLPMPGKSDVYFTAGKGYKSGGFNTQMFSDVVQQELQMKLMEKMPGYTPSVPYSVSDIISYRPEKSWNYEVGTHVQCADGRVHTDLALFYIDCRDQQLTMFPEGTTTGRITTNAPKCRMWGAEAQIRFSPSDRWQFNVNYGYTNARFVKFMIGERNYKNNVVPYAPAHTFFASATYRQPFAGSLKALEVTSAVRGVGRIYWNEENTASQPFYAQLQLSATAVFGWLEAELWAENLTGTKFDVFYFKSMQKSFVQKGKPRRFGLTLRLNFQS